MTLDHGFPRASAEHGVWTFAPFTLDGMRYLLQRAGEEIALDRACIEILVTLLSHPGEVVTKDELLEAAWPGRIVTENSLTKAIARLRFVLEGLDCIRTVHGYGYKFVGEAHFRASSPALVLAPSNVFQAGDPVPLRRGWTLMRQLGRGGCSEVWIAEHVDTGEIRAIKFADGETGLRALKREVALHRLISAGVDANSAVVGLLGWNLTEPPFFIGMPVIDAGNLRQWSERAGGLRAMPLDARLEFMARLADGVARVHALGIIHKDLKPENILISLDEDGSAQPLLSDFGAGWIAHYGPRHPAFPLSSTFTSAFHDSPQMASALYAAPEILRAETPTTRADVYALGVLLYQMVAGDLKRPLAPGWEQDIADEVLRTDIHNAADSDPDRRLANAHALGERLRSLTQRRAELGQRKLQEEKFAQALRRTEQARIWRRIGLAVAATLVVGLLSTGWMYWRAEQARVQATQDAHRAQAMLDFLTDDILSTGNPYGDRAKEITVHDAVERSAQRLEHRFGADPEAKATMHWAIAKVYQGLSDYDAGIAHFNAAATVSDGDATTRPLLNRILIDRASAEIDDDRLGDADKTLDRAEAAVLSAEEPGLAKLRLLATRAQLRYEQGRYREAHAIAQQIISVGPTNDNTADDPRADAFWYAALSSQELADYELAENEYHQLIALRESALGPSHPYTAWAYTNYGGLLAEMGRNEEGEATLRKAISIFEVALGNDHPDTTAPWFRLAQSYLAQQRWTDATPILENVLAMRRQKLGPNHAWTRSAIFYLADDYAWLGRLDEAEQMIRSATPDSGSFGEDNDLNITLLETRVDVSYLRKSFDSALATNAELSKAILKVHSDQYPRYAMTECMAGRILFAQNEFEQALSRVTKCERLLVAKVSATHPYRRQAQALLVYIKTQSPNRSAAAQ
jgi:non-specific serine/threonine protein kinase